MLVTYFVQGSGLPLTHLATQPSQFPHMKAWVPFPKLGKQAVATPNANVTYTTYSAATKQKRKLHTEAMSGALIEWVCQKYKRARTPKQQREHALHCSRTWELME